MLIDDLEALTTAGGNLTAPVLLAIGIAVMVQCARRLGMPTDYATPLAILIAQAYFVGFTWPHTTAADVGQALALGLAASGGYSQWKRFFAADPPPDQPAAPATEPTPTPSYTRRDRDGQPPPYYFTAPLPATTYRHPNRRKLPPYNFADEPPFSRN